MKTSSLAEAFNDLGVRLSSPDQIVDWCAEGAVLLTAESMTATIADKDDPDLLICSGLFALVFSDHFSRLAGAEKEMVAVAALQAITPDQDIEMIVGLHNDLAKSAPTLLNSIGDTCAKWVSTRSFKYVDDLRRVFSEFYFEFKNS